MHAVLSRQSHDRIVAISQPDFTVTERSVQSNPSLPSPELLEKQAEWLAAARARMLRRVGIAQMRRVLDLGAGYGLITEELERRSRGVVIALDRSSKSLYEVTKSPSILRIAGDAARLPLVDSSFELVFCQCGLLWMNPFLDVIEEIDRILEPGGLFLALEPDYLSMIEYPAGTAIEDIWKNALERAGADPARARKIPAALESCGFTIRVDFLERLHPSSPFRLDFLRELALTEAEEQRLIRSEAQMNRSSQWSTLAHLPFFLITAKKAS